MQQSLNNSEWDQCEVRVAGGSTATYVYRRAANSGRAGKTGECAHSFEPWVVVAPSAVMARCGYRGKGLYAARTFACDDYVGRYEGETIGHYPSRFAAMTSGEARRRVMRGHDKLVTLRAIGGGVHLVDGERGPPPFVQMCNDGRGTALSANCGITDAGWLRVLHARIPRFDPRKSIAENAHAELRIEYGDEYWALFDELGKSAAYAIDVS